MSAFRFSALLKFFILCKMYFLISFLVTLSPHFIQFYYIVNNNTCHYVVMMNYATILKFIISIENLLSFHTCTIKRWNLLIFEISPFFIVNKFNFNDYFVSRCKVCLFSREQNFFISTRSGLFLLFLVVM